LYLPPLPGFVAHMELSLPGTLYSLATGCALASFYTLNKKTSRAGNPLQIIFWIFAAHLPPILLWAACGGDLHVDWGYVPPGLGVLALTVAGNFLAIRALSLSPFSLMMPVMCLSPVFTSIIGIPLLGEWPSGLQWAGILLAVFGVLCLYAPKDRPWDIFSLWAAFVRERGGPSMALSALSWAISAPMDKLALRHATPASHALFVFAGLVLFLLIWLTARGEWRLAPIARSYWPLLVATGASGAAADILQLFALQQTAAGPFEAIKRVTSQVLALILGYYIFGESLTRPKLVGIAIISISVPLVVL
jgi:drug/metabolite transporter (DMT)-like permease